MCSAPFDPKQFFLMASFHYFILILSTVLSTAAIKCYVGWTNDTGPTKAFECSENATACIRLNMGWPMKYLPGDYRKEARELERTQWAACDDRVPADCGESNNKEGAYNYTKIWQIYPKHFRQLFKNKRGVDIGSSLTGFPQEWPNVHTRINCCKGDLCNTFDNYTYGIRPVAPELY